MYPLAYLFIEVIESLDYGHELTIQMYNYTTKNILDKKRLRMNQV